MKFRLNDISHFIETSSCKTIVQASHKLEISQPALSESLKRLESDLGYTLFYRSRTGIQLTPSGKLFLEKAKIALSYLHELDIKNDQSEIFANRTISVGCHTTVAQYSIPKALKFLKEKAPDFKIELKHDLSRNIQTEIQNGRIDIGLVINPVEVPDLIIQKLDYDKISVWSHPQVDESDTLICNPQLFQTQSILKKWKNKPHKIIATDSLELICRLTHEKIGYGVIPERAVLLSHNHLKVHNHLPTYKDEICLVYRPEFGKIACEKLVIDSLKSAIKSY